MIYVLKAALGNYSIRRVIKVEFTLPPKTMRKPDRIYKTTTLKTLDIM